MDKLKAEGSSVNPYAACQASTGQNFQTGEALKEKDMGAKGVTMLGSQPDKTGRERESISNGTLANSPGGTEEKAIGGKKPCPACGEMNEPDENGQYFCVCGESYMGKSFKGAKAMKTKDGFGIEDGHLPHDEAAHAELDLPGDATAEGQEETHPFGYQVLARKYVEHGDHLKDHEDMLGPLEDDAVRKFLEEEQQWHAKRMADIESIVKRHKRYKDLPPIKYPDDDLEEVDETSIDEYETKDALEDVEDQDDGIDVDDQGDMDTLDDVGVAADSVDDRIEEGEEPPTPEEAIEGMEVEQKELAPAPKSDVRGFPAKPQKDATRSVRSAGTKHMCGACSKAYDEAAELGEEVDEKKLCSKCSKSHDRDDELDEFEQHKALEDEDEISEDEKKALRKAIKFLNDIAAEESEWDDERRMNSYHFHKAMDEFDEHDDLKEDKDFPEMDEVDDEAEVTEKALEDDDSPAFDEDGELVTKDLAKPAKADVPGFKQDPMEESTAKVSSAGTKGLDDDEDLDEKTLSPKRSLIRGISKFLKRLSRTKEFGDADRDLAREAVKAMEDIVEDEETKGIDDEMVDVEDMEGDDLDHHKAVDDVEQHADDEAPYEPGEMGEKALQVKEDEDGMWLAIDGAGRIGSDKCVRFETKDEAQDYVDKYNGGDADTKRDFSAWAEKRLKKKGLMDPVFDALKKLGIDPKKLFNGPDALKYSKIVQNGLMKADSIDNIAAKVAKAAKAAGKSIKSIKSEPYSPEWEEEERQEHEHKSAGRSLIRKKKAIGEDDSTDPARKPVKVVQRAGQWVVVDASGRVVVSVGSKEEGEAFLAEHKSLSRVKTKAVDEDQEDVDEKALTELRKAQAIQDRSIKQFKKHMEALIKGFSLSD